MRGADYNYGLKDGVVWIEDLDLGNKSVTNDIENVLNTINIASEDNLEGMKIVYKDSMGIWDGVIFKKQGERSIITIYPIGVETLKEAIEYVKRM